MDQSRATCATSVREARESQIVRLRELDVVPVWRNPDRVLLLGHHAGLTHGCGERPCSRISGQRPATAHRNRRREQRISGRVDDPQLSNRDGDADGQRSSGVRRALRAGHGRERRAESQSREDRTGSPDSHAHLRDAQTEAKNEGGTAGTPRAVAGRIPTRSSS